MVEEGAYWLAWTQISGIGPVLLRRLQQHFGTLATAWNATKVQLGEVEGLGFQTLEKVVQQRSRLHPEQLFTKHQQENPHFWTPADADYPRLLLETPSPPPILYYRGEVELQENLGQKPMIGIVGTRQPSEYGIRWTRQISTALAKNGFTVVSGMAEGIDTESHIAAMKAGGRTIAVLGTGVDVIYPHKNPELQTVMDAFAVGVSEVLAIEALPFDFIVQQTGMAAGSVSSALLQLELMGLVSQLPGMRYQKS